MPPDSHAADRNLLFGIVALQMDFIIRDQRKRDRFAFGSLG
jgi:hypothetical protein